MCTYVSAHLHLRNIKILQELMEQILVLLRERNTLAMWRDNGEIQEFGECDSFSQLRQMAYKDMSCILKILISLYHSKWNSGHLLMAAVVLMKLLKCNMEKEGTLLTGQGTLSSETASQQNIWCKPSVCWCFWLVRDNSQGLPGIIHKHWVGGLQCMVCMVLDMVQPVPGKFSKIWCNMVDFSSRFREE